MFTEDFAVDIRAGGRLDRKRVFCARFAHEHESAVVLSKCKIRRNECMCTHIQHSVAEPFLCAQPDRM